jgi:hypothetical protein
MIVLFHIAIAVTSILYAGYVFLSPSKKKFYFSYGLITATFISGTYLIFLNTAHLVQSCFTGLIYLGVVTTITVFAQKKLAKEESIK